MRELTREELKDYGNKHYLTVGKLKQFIEEHQLKDDSIILVERVKDFYYEENNWGSYLKESYHTHCAKKWNADIESGKYLDLDKYPNMDEHALIPCSDADIKETMSQYHPIFTCVNYKDDKDILFLNLHY